jgi:hypothetical protein
MFGVLCAGVGFAAGLFVAAGARGDGWGLMLFAAPAAAFLSGAGAWWALVAQSGKGSGWRGAAAGALAGVVAHPLCWVFQLTASGEWPGSKSLLALVTVMTAVSLLVAGWLTVLVGAAMGWGLATAGARSEQGRS